MREVVRNVWVVKDGFVRREFRDMNEAVRFAVESAKESARERGVSVAEAARGIVVEDHRVVAEPLFEFVGGEGVWE